MRVVAMFRVSTEKQANEGASLDAQERQFQRLATQSGWESVATFRGCESATQASQERAVLQQVLHCIRETAPDAIYVHEQSRLTRGDELEVATLLRELRERRLKIIVGGVVRDLASLDERFMVGIQSLVDRAEAERIKERHQRGKQEKARQGLKNSGPTPFGYRNPPPGDPLRGQLQVIAEKAAIVQRVYSLAASGHGVRAICKKLNNEGVPSPRGGKWGKTTVQRMLENPAYRGCHVTGGWTAEPGSKTFRFDPDSPDAIVVENAHEAIISNVLWQKAQRRQAQPRTLIPRMLTGLLSLNGQQAHGDSIRGQAYYRPPRGAKGGPWVPVAEADAVVWQAFVKAMSDPSYMQSVIAAAKADNQTKDIETRQRHLAGHLARLEKRRDRLLDMRADGEITSAEFREKSKEARRQIRAAKDELEHLNQQAASQGSQWIKQVFAAARLLVGSEHRLNEQQRREVLREATRHVAVKARRVASKQLKNKQGHYVKGSFAQWKIESVTFDLAACSPSGDPDNDTDCSCWARRAAARR